MTRVVIFFTKTAVILCLRMFFALAFVFSLLIQTQNFQYAKREEKKTKEKNETKYNKQQKHNV